MNNLINTNPLYLSNIEGKTNQDKKAVFMVFVADEDTYYLSSKLAHKITIFDKNEKELIQGNELSIDLKKDGIYFVEVETLNANTEFYLSVKKHNPSIAVPYELNIKNDGKDIPLNSNDKADPLKPALIEMEKRKGGTYLYSNVPEAMPLEAIDSILMQNKNLTGDCFLTFEHQNSAGIPYVYLGYRLWNHSDKDVYVTVRNIGYQVDGSWLGEKSWMDYYGVKYEMDLDAFKTEPIPYGGKVWEAHEWFKAYLNFDTNYTPRPIAPTTYRIPSGKYIYVIGGTTEDAFNNTNVNESADLKICPHCCANGNVFFSVVNGDVTGELCAYVDYKKINSKDVVVQHFRRYGEKDDMGGRIGVSDHHGVIDTNPIWIFNDATPSQQLPVKYYPYYADKLKDSYEPMEPVTDCYKHEYVGNSWKTHLSSQLNHDYVGEDIVTNVTYYKGKEITLSPYIANPGGNIWDFGNWMIEYQENCVFVNQGDNERTLRFYLTNGGSLFIIVKDENGNVLRNHATLITCTGKRAVYECKVPAHSRKLISVQFVLSANNNGAVEHFVELV